MTAVVEGRLDSLVAEITPAVAFTSLLDDIFGWWAHRGGRTLHRRPHGRSAHQTSPMGAGARQWGAWRRAVGVRRLRSPSYLGPSAHWTSGLGGGVRVRGSRGASARAEVCGHQDEEILIPRTAAPLVLEALLSMDGCCPPRRGRSRARGRENGVCVKRRQRKRRRAAVTHRCRWYRCCWYRCLPPAGSGLPIAKFSIRGRTDWKDAEPISTGRSMAGSLALRARRGTVHY